MTTDTPGNAAKDAVALAASSLTGRIALWSIRRRRRVLLAWLLVSIAGLGACFAVPADTDVEEDGSGESWRAQQRIEERFGSEEAELNEFIVISHPTRSVDDAEFQRAARELISDVRGLRERETFEILGQPVEGSHRFVAATSSYFEAAAPREQSPFVRGLPTGGDITFVLVELEPDFNDAVEGIDIFTNVIERAAAAHPDFSISVGGEASVTDQLNTIIDDDFARASSISIPLTGVILILAFGSVAAAVFPIVVGFAAISIAVGVMNLVSQGVFALHDAFAQVILLVGLGAAIDYGIYLVMRYRRERAHGYPELAAVVAASGTAGKATLIAAMTTVLALCGMFFMGDAIFASLGLAAIIAVVVALLMALTLMPAWLGTAGDGIDRWRVPIIGRGFAAGEHGGFLAGAIDRMLAHPALYAPLAVAVMVVIASPLFAFNLGVNGVRSFPEEADGRAALLELEESFSLGLVQPATVVIDAGRGNNVFRDEIQAAVAEFKSAVRAETAAPGTPDRPYGVPIRDLVNEGADMQLILIPVNADAGEQPALDAVRHLRADLVPAAFGDLNADVLVTGQTAGIIDFVDEMNARLPITLAFVIGTSYLVLVVMFRSLVLPLAAILLNLLAVGAAFGVLKLTFQDGYALEGILSYEATGIIEAWIPIFVFAIMFGISFDDLTLALGRVKEAHEGGEDVDTAIRSGIKAVAMTIVAADLILAGVVGLFCFLRLIGMQQVGLAMLVSVVLSAALVVVVVMPALLRAVGDRLWYFPAWLDWVPRVTSDDAAIRDAYAGQAPAPASGD